MQDLKTLILTLAVAFLSQLSLSTNMEHIELPEAEYPGEGWMKDADPVKSNKDFWDMALGIRHWDIQVRTK